MKIFNAEKWERLRRARQERQHYYSELTDNWLLARDKLSTPMAHFLNRFDAKGIAEKVMTEDLTKSSEHLKARLSAIQKDLDLKAEFGLVEQARPDLLEIYKIGLEVRTLYERRERLSAENSQAMACFNRLSAFDEQHLGKTGGPSVVNDDSNRTIQMVRGWR